ncbi:Protein of unknown function [Prosthecobacter debontii]|uniref:Tat (Twin-arginine translocation) pathway signal sequence n=1 Tax=Prosthecobacter debontii TaxID=48467 RepID=A0A1T4XRW6_9BACT|nr:DUF1501 domain-containing protein [Prosthecobacter debontii]SKA92297.1 Protein of unknown function [Prosthecobacter debontii]
MLPSRRSFLQTTGCGFGYLAASALAQRQAWAAGGVGFQPHHVPKAKRVIFLFMQGGVSHVDSYDYKPRLLKDDQKIIDIADPRTVAKTGKGSPQRLKKPLWEFAQQGESGRWASNLFPHINRHVDDLCFLHGMHTEGVAHGPATLFLHTGTTSFIRPSMGAWVMYGLGSENENLPGFVTISPSLGNGGPRNYGNAFLPARYQGTPLGRSGLPSQEAKIKNIVNTAWTPEQQRRQYELLGALHAQQMRPGDTEIEAVIQSYELAWRMQNNAPDALDLAQESESTLQLYGIGEKVTDNFGRQCLMARRLAEQGVRYIQVNYGDNSNNPAWDQHSNLPKHGDHAAAVDKPIAGLLEDLKQRGLLEDTIVWWGGEFGRTPYAERNGTGRDHNPAGFTVWLAGGGVKAGFAHGATDEIGFQAVDGKVHMHDLHATVLHLLGLDHERLTFRHAGRDFRLTDVHGHVVKEILA